MSPSAWEKLKVIAAQVIAESIEEFPPEIRTEAVKVPVIFEKVCEDDPDILGIYGHFTAGEISEANGPIVLYLETIAEICEEEGEDFEEEIRVTYLHELGHHFGWDEGDLEERGLG